MGELREKDLKDGTVSDALLALLDDSVQYHVKSLMSTTDYKGKAEVRKYLAEPAQMISHSYEEDGYKPEQHGDKITVFSDAKKFGLWIKVRAVFTFAANGKIVDVWAGKASAVPSYKFLEYGKHVEAAPSGRNWETVKKYMSIREKDLKDGTVSDALLALLDDSVQYHVKSLMSTTDYKGKAEVRKYSAEPAQMISHSYEEDGYKPEQH